MKKAVIKDTLFDVPCTLCSGFITAKSQEAVFKNSIITVAKVIDDDTFDYGISGVFKFTKPMGLKKGDSVCNNCLKNHKDNYKPLLSVSCGVCGKLYQPCFSHMDPCRQAWGCAADAAYELGSKDLVVGAGWGSRYDCGRWKVVVPVVKAGDMVCDDCIDAFVEEGSFEKLESTW